jgi:hypothetical protein
VVEDLVVAEQLLAIQVELKVFLVLFQQLHQQAVEVEWVTAAAVILQHPLLKVDQVVDFKLVFRVQDLVIHLPQLPLKEIMRVLQEVLQDMVLVAEVELVVWVELLVLLQPEEQVVWVHQHKLQDLQFLMLEAVVQMELV